MSRPTPPITRLSRHNDRCVIYQGDCTDILPILSAGSVHTCVTSPPYWGLRDYGVDGQFGLERTPEEYTARLVEVFREVRRILRDDGTLWLNMGDTYASSNRRQRCPGRSKKHPAYEGDAFRDGLRPGTPNGMKPKDLVGIPWRVAFALRDCGWYLRQDIIWSKPNPMPESVRDRFVKAHEYLFLFSKRKRYYFDIEAVKETSKTRWNSYRRFTARNHKEGYDPLMRTRGYKSYHRDVTHTDRNRRSVWQVATKPNRDVHFATFPPDLIRPCILAGCPEGGTVLDPFAGTGTTGLVARQHGRRATLIELNEEYCEIARRRIEAEK